MDFLLIFVSFQSSRTLFAVGVLNVASSRRQMCRWWCGLGEKGIAVIRLNLRVCIDLCARSERGFVVRAYAFTKGRWSRAVFEIRGQLYPRCELFGWIKLTCE